MVMYADIVPAILRSSQWVSLIYIHGINSNESSINVNLWLI